MPNRRSQNPSSLEFSSEDFKKIRKILESWITVQNKSLVSFDEKQKDTLLHLLQNGSNKAQIFWIWVELLQIQNYQNEYNTLDKHTEICVTRIKKQLEEVFSDEVIQREMQWTTQRNHKEYFNIEFAKWRFVFHTIPNILHEDIPGFEKTLTDNFSIWLKPSEAINNMLFSWWDESKFLQDHIYKVNAAYEFIIRDIDTFARFTTNSWIHWIPSIINWREFYLTTALYQNLYSRIKEYQTTLQWSHEEWSQIGMDPIDYNFNINNNNLDDIIDIRQESFLDSLITQVKQAYLLWDEDMIIELKKSLTRMWKEKHRRELVSHLKNLWEMYTRLKWYIETIKRNYGSNPYYSIITTWNNQDTKKEVNPNLQDELWFFRHQKFIDRRGVWNGIAKKVFLLQKHENEFYSYLCNLNIK